MTFDQQENNLAAADWLVRCIREAITETERRFGVYVAADQLRAVPPLDWCPEYWRIRFAANIWPASMRIIETEPESEAIG